jgi:Asp/Glu/hydantoin racemase
MWNAPVKALMDRYKEPDTQIVIENLDMGPESLEFAYDKAYAKLPIVQQAETAQQEGCDGMITYCSADSCGKQ